MSVLQKYTGGQPVFMNNALVGNELCAVKYRWARVVYCISTGGQ